MAHATAPEPNGAMTPDSDSNDQLAVPSKRKRDSGDEPPAEAKHQVEQKPTAPRRWPAGNQRDLIKSYFDVLTSLDVEHSILKRPLSEASPDLEPDAKRQKSSEPPSRSSVSDKVVAGEYADMEDMANDVLSAVKAALSDLDSKPSEDADKTMTAKAALRIRDFKNKAMQILNREKAYPNVAAAHSSGDAAAEAASDAGETVLSVVGYAPQERRLFSSLPLARGTDLFKLTLPPGVSISRVAPSTPREMTQTLGELFAPPRSLPPLQPPKQPKTQAKGNILDFYHPELTDTSKYRTNCYYTTKLTAGHYLDYSNATPSSQTKTKQRERAQSLAGKKPSASELEMTEMEALFRGAFSSFAPCKDDAAAVVPSSVAGRMWWQKSGQRSFQRLIEIECYGDVDDADAQSTKLAELDEAAVQEAIDNWDESVVDPTLEDVMGSGRDEGEKEADEILDEVSDMIETLASYQRIRNLTLPNSQNRQSSDPVTGDMLATAGPQPSEEEHATYQMLKAQLALIIKTLPPYAVAKLNGDQLDDLLISTRVQVQTDQYRGVMEEDDVGLQARLRAQQQAQQAQQAHQRTPSISTPYGTKYQAPNHPAPNYQQPRNIPPSAHQARPPQPNQYTRPNGYPNQYATQLAKAQTPYGHQNMPLYAGQQRPGYAQMPLQPQQQPLQQQPAPAPPQHQLPPQQPIQPQQGNPNARYAFPQGYPQQQGTPGQPNYGAAYTNGSGAPPRTMSPQVPQRPPYSPSPNLQQNQRFPSQGNAPMNRYPGSAAGQPGSNQNPGLTGYHTVIPEAQQQRILDQAKARVAAQERTAMFADKIAQPGASPGMGYGTPGVGQRQGSNGTPGAAFVPPQKVTPVPVPVIPGAGQQQQQRKSDA
ncbi:uncharacterized protein HRG_05071 [Hirsutella rhossiliensis]|uniref:Uncharacterized protein n=1 Tax=Hirsutella rhossiliensis TaxID=111463 RepID=A0A9P8MYF1_9HYPO|nr:uncharacterized protein HRG_05071 [Hirsutella rhossiliensis]KAH0964643.1 hypothetical protein HRG_05071 [Hirsutella rhossiliensis]